MFPSPHHSPVVCHHGIHSEKQYVSQVAREAASIAASWLGQQNLEQDS